MKFKVHICSFLFFFSLLIQNGFAQEEHPFLIVSESAYPELQSRINQNPWKYMHNSALQRWNEDFEEKDWRKFAAQLGYNMMLWITDPANQSIYRDKIIEIINRWSENKEHLGTSGHTNTVDAASAFFNSVVAVDLIHNYCSDVELQQLESILQEINDWFEMEASDSWLLSRYGVLTLWSLYKQDTANTNQYKQMYLNYLFDVSMMDDGSWNQSPGYIMARLGGNRLGKSHIIDVLDYTNEYNFYQDSRMQSLMEWLGSFALTPFGSISRFGDSGLIKAKRIGADNPLLFRMNKYGDKSAGISSWYLDTLEETGPYSFDLSNFYNFVLMPETEANPIKPVSLLKTYTGAALLDPTNSSEALSGILYSLKREPNQEGGFGHAHYDVNSINITGYGEHLITNAGTQYVGLNGNGFNYPGYTPDNKRWFLSWMQNTVHIADQNEHVEKTGKGLIDSLVGGSVEFGRTGSGEAISNGVHNRYLFFIKPSQNTNGYFAMIDEVVPNNSNDPIHINLHPNTRSEIITITDQMHYRAKADGYVQDASDGTEGIEIFYGTPPNNAQFKSAYKGDFVLGPILTPYLESTYNINHSDRLQAATILFPYDGDHMAPAMTRISAQNYSGAFIDHDNDIEDVFLASTGPGKYDYQGVLINGRGVFYRRINNTIDSYAVALGYGFDNAELPAKGFASSEAVSIQMDDTTGFLRVGKENTTITFNYPSLSEVQLNNISITPISSDENSITINVAKGNYKVNLISQTLSVSDVPNDVNIIQIFPNPTLDHIYVNNLKGNQQYTIYDLKGQIIDSGMISQDQKIDLQTLSKGIYFLKIKGFSMKSFLKQ